MTQYRVTVTVSGDRDGWGFTRQVPTFTIDGDTLGIIDGNGDHIRTIVHGIVNPLGLDVDVDVTWSEVEDTTRWESAGFIVDGKIILWKRAEVVDAVIVQGLREAHSNYIAKFDGPLSCYMHSALNEGRLVVDDEASNGHGEWAGRFGRRVLREDDRGFVWCHKFYGSDRATAVQAAEEYMAIKHAEWYDDEDDMVMSGGRGPEEPQASAGWGEG